MIIENTEANVVQDNVRMPFLRNGCAVLPEYTFICIKANPNLVKFLYRKSKIIEADNLYNKGEYQAAWDIYYNVQEEIDSEVKQYINFRHFRANDKYYQAFEDDYSLSEKKYYTTITGDENGFEQKMKECKDGFYDMIKNLIISEKYDEVNNEIHNANHLDYDYPCHKVWNTIYSINNMEDGEEHNLCEDYRIIKEYSDEYNISGLLNNSKFDYMLSLNGEWICVKGNCFVEGDEICITDGKIKKDYYYYEIVYESGKYYRYWIDKYMINGEIVNYDGEGDDTFDILDTSSFNEGIEESYKRK